MRDRWKSPKLYQVREGVRISFQAGVQRGEQDAEDDRKSHGLPRHTEAAYWIHFGASEERSTVFNHNLYTLVQHLLSYSSSPRVF